MAHGVTEKVDIGGNGAWSGGTYGGYTYVGDFVMTAVPNIAFVFSGNLADGNARYTGDACSHESGHSFGLLHQSTYSGSTKTAEYSLGPGNGTAPLMGNSYAAARSLWWYGQDDVSSTTYQDDMAVISGPTNGFGYRAEPADTSPATATPLVAQSGGTLGASGLIIHTTDTDYYSFTSAGGTVNFTVSVPQAVADLVPKVELLDASGSKVIAAGGPIGSNFSASLSVNLPAGGKYLLLVTSNGGYGNVGQYAISGTVAGTGYTGGQSASQPAAQAVQTAANLAATASSPSQVNLSWTGAGGATGLLVERTTNYVNWSVVASLSPGMTTFSDGSVTPGTAYGYVIVAVGLNSSTAVSTPALLVTPALPTPPAAVVSLRAVSVASRQVVLSWQPGSANAQSYVVERTSNGRTWTRVGSLSASTTSFTDSSVAPLKTYVYRVRAFNTLGFSAPTLLRVNTPRMAPLRLIRVSRVR